jgi:flagellar biosynthesis/type III secretory pathway chaperone
LEHEPGADLLARLESLLARERDALLTGRLQDIPELVDEKETVIEKLASAELSTAQLDPLQNQVAHNQALLESAMAG